MNNNQLHETVRFLMQQGKGILAADESNGTADKRLASVGVEGAEENRRRYREMLLATPGVEKYLSGVILYDETIRQEINDGVLFRDYLKKLEILPGIKVDAGLIDDPAFSGGKVTSGLEGLSERLHEYNEMGARFCKWRSTISVESAITDAVIENATRMAEYARLCQEVSLVPIVEPEVLITGNHTAEACEKVLTNVLALTVEKLKEKEVDLSGVIVKTSMAVSGKDAEVQAGSEEVGERTARALTTALPKEIGGVVFLSGGQTPEDATSNFNAIARHEPLPWQLTFSFARALQGAALDEWQGDDQKKESAQALFLQRLSLVVSADAGGYSSTMEMRA